MSLVHVGRKPYGFKQAFASRSIESPLYNGWVFVAVPQSHLHAIAEAVAEFAIGD